MENGKQGLINRIKLAPVWVLFGLFCWCLPTSLLISRTVSFADNSVCATVKIEIDQKLALERQAFDAHMAINNGLSNITLDNVNVTVTFSDANGNAVLATSDPNDTSALFFIKVNTMTNIGDVSGAGTVQPSSSADVHWLIIPAPGASNGLNAGTIYYVGATLTYNIGGQQQTTVVTPDYINVLPMPEMALDYFLPTDVYGDDAFTTQIEPPIPFSLGVRVKNNGKGTAQNLQIDSAQPKIVDNQQGLLINFVITGSELNGQPAPSGTDPLLVNFGDLQPATCGTARWIMECTLSGKFVSFTASFSHSDDLGGKLTALIDAVNTHTLVHDVLVDLPGRDSIRDFLAKDVDVLRVYESEGVDTVVMDQSSSSNLQPAGSSGTQVTYTMSTPVTAGFMYVQLQDPFGGQKIIKQVLRSDGKIINTNNAWFSKTRYKSDPWQYFLNLFDVNTTNSYTLVFDDPSTLPQPPTIQFIPDKQGAEGQQTSFIVQASDADGSYPSFSASPLPAGAQFSTQSQTNGVTTAVFDWTPLVGQSGTYPITYSATNGTDATLTSSQRATIIVCSAADTNCNGIPDAWEMKWFGHLIDASADASGDGLNNLQKFQLGLDPLVSHVPTVPVVYSPVDKARVAEFTPDLTVTNSNVADGLAITYTFEVYSDQSMTNLVASETGVASGTGTTFWTVPADANLLEDTWYYWRVKATALQCTSKWAYASFFVNTISHPPGPFNVSAPSDGSQVKSNMPVLSVTNSTDVDQYPLTYTFEVYSDANMSNLVVTSPAVPQALSGTTSWTVTIPLTEDTWYFWKALATDPNASTPSPSASFLVNAIDEPPLAPAIVSPASGIKIAASALDLIVNDSSDQDQNPLTYYFEIDQVNTFDSAAKTVSGSVAPGSTQTLWHVSGLTDHTFYYWRVKASDGQVESPWSVGSFFVEITVLPPSIPTVKNPGNEAWVMTLQPTLEVNPSVDLDMNSVSYNFELYSDYAMNNLLAQQATITATQWKVPFGLPDRNWYFWRAQAEDEDGAGAWSPLSSFFVYNNGTNNPPDIAFSAPIQNVYTNAASFLVQLQENDPDNNSNVSLYYDQTGQGASGNLIAADLKSDTNVPSDSYTWDISQLPEGTYYLYAVITNGTLTKAVYAPASITVDRTPPTAQASPRGGTYSSSQSVQLTASEPATIYYTLDGSAPTLSSAQYGTTPIAVSKTTTIRFMAVDRAGNQGATAIETYTVQRGTPIPHVSGSAYNYPDNTRYAASFAMDVTGGATPTGSLHYYYSRTRMDFVSTEITTVSASGDTATISGSGTMNGSEAYTYTMTVVGGAPDRIAITISKADGSGYYVSPLQAIAGGNLSVSYQ